MAAITEAEKHWKRRITDPTLTDEQRNDAAIKYDRIVKRRQKKSARGKYAKKKTDPGLEPKHSAICAKTATFWCTPDCPWTAWRDQRDEFESQAAPVAAPAEVMPKPVAKPAPAPKPQPAPVVEEVNPFAELKRLMAESAKVVRDDVPQPQPVKKAPIPQGQFPMLPGATIEESKSCWLLDGWGTKMKPDEYAHHCGIRAEYNRRMTEQREMRQRLTAPLPKTAEEIAAEKTAIQQRKDDAERSKARTFAPPAFSEPRRGQELNAVQVKEVTTSTMAHATDAGISVELDKRNWLPDQPQS